MATAVRQRVPFRFSEEDQLDGHVLDEQEQEEVLVRLRQESEGSNTVYRIGLQILYGLSLLVHLVFLFSSTKVSPLVALFPGSSSEAIPFPTGFTVLQLLIHLNLSLVVLPQNHNIRQILFLHPDLPYSLALPLPLSHPIAITLPTLAPATALVLGRGRADILWWTVPGVLMGITALILKWIKDEEKDLQGLEKLRYTARGA
ncbi:hypothetical protein C8Q74DRAFT_1274495 [Fomes fomentarius]|nr:hypothetical protein C8Q74DRAFT_1274495 [Fomes fomentarius]